MDMDKLSKIGEKKNGEKTSFDSIYPLGERRFSYRYREKSPYAIAINNSTGTIPKVEKSE